MYQSLLCKHGTWP